MIDREFQRGFVKLYALWRAAKGEAYGVQIIEEMGKLGFKVSPGTLYPVLHALLEEKDVAVTDRVVNGKVRKGNADPRVLLVHFLREQLRLTGTHIGCDTSQCGACTVLIDGRSAKSCTLYFSNQ